MKKPNSHEYTTRLWQVNDVSLMTNNFADKNAFLDADECNKNIIFAAQVYNFPLYKHPKRKANFSTINHLF